MKKVLVPLAQGFEMVEALSIVDVFRRAAVHVDLAAVGDGLEVSSSHQVVVVADKLLGECGQEQYDLIVLPGGIPGAENLKNSELLGTLLKRQHGAGKLYGAICASPAVVLEHHGLLEDRKATCHPMFIEQLPSQEHGAEGVVFDRNCVTARGAGASIDFAMELLGILCGEEKKQEVARQMAMV